LTLEGVAILEEDGALAMHAIAIPIALVGQNNIIAATNEHAALGEL